MNLGARVRALAFVISLIALGAVPATAAAVPVIVVTKDTADPSSLADRHGLGPSHVYRSAIVGFAADVSPAERRALNADPRVTSVVDDQPVVAAGRWNTKIAPPVLTGHQEIPTGIRRIGALSNRTARIDGIDQRVDVDVAVIDSGVDPAHPDLNVAGTVNCIGKKYEAHAHGTHVAGTIGAIDNNRGVVGVAPGARIWGVRIFNQKDSGTVSSLLCGLDWVDRNRGIVDVVNLSGVYGGFDGGDCGISDDDPAHALVCAITDSGVPFVAAAGNESADTAGSLPAAYDEVIAVSALTDYDGLQGGLSQPTCWPAGADDSLAFFSNFGPDVDIAAPGVCILSSWTGPEYEYELGTSMAAPHVAGAAALYKAAHPSATAARVKAALLAAAQAGPLPGDNDGFAEPLLNVARL